MYLSDVVSVNSWAALTEAGGWDVMVTELTSIGPALRRLEYIKVTVGVTSGNSYFLSYSLYLGKFPPEQT